MMASIRSGESGQDTTLIEKNPALGKKLLLSGKGRCNLTNSCDLDSFIKRFSGHSGQFLRDAFARFFNQDLIRFFQKNGLELKTERQLRVFPVSDKSHSVLAILKKELQKNKVKVCLNAVLKDIFIQGHRAKGVLLSDGRTFAADKIILATGGVSYSFTGSTGEGIMLAKRLGHRIESFHPGLVPLQIRQDYPPFLEGLTLKNIRLVFSNSERQIFSPVGELLFTHSGISGPLVLTFSGKVAEWLQENKIVIAEVDLKPALSIQVLEQRLLREFRANPKKNIKKILKNLLPQRLADLLVRISDIPAEKNASQISQDERRKLVGLLKHWRMTVARPRPIEEAMITRGGVSLSDINPRTMESRKIRGLYFAGEMIDVDADTGGFNLQAAFSTGYLAGYSASTS